MLALLGLEHCFFNRILNRFKGDWSPGKYLLILHKQFTLRTGMEAAIDFLKKNCKTFLLPARHPVCKCSVRALWKSEKDLQLLHLVQ